MASMIYEGASDISAGWSMSFPHISKTILLAAAGYRGAYALKVKSTTLILRLLYAANKRFV